MFGWTIGTPLGPLYKWFGDRVNSDIGRCLAAKVSSIIHNGDWQWSRTRKRVIQEIIKNTPSILLTDVSNEDALIWILSLHGNYTMKFAWNAVRIPHDTTDWHKVVWFNKHIPR